MTRKRNVRNITKVRRCVRAISPVIATLLMIAITVVAALVAYAWISGYIGGTTVKTGNSIQIQSFAGDTANPGNLIVYVQNVGQGSVQLNPSGAVYVNNTLYQILFANGQSVTGVSVPITEGQTIGLSVHPVPYSPGDYMVIKVVTSGGTSTQVTGTGTGQPSVSPTPPTGTATPAVGVPTLSPVSPITLGGSTTSTVTVSGGVGTPTGVVTFQLSTDGSNWGAIGAAKSLSGGVATSDAYTPLAAGSNYQIRVQYSGDVNYASGTGSPAPLTVSPAAPTVPAPTVTPNPDTVNNPVSVSVTVSGVTGVTPTGTATFQVQIGAGSFADIGSAVALVAGAASTPYTPLTADSYQFRVTYSGDGNYNGATGSATTVPVVAGLSASILPTSWTMDAGQSKTFTATGAGGSGSYTGYHWYVDSVVQAETTSSFSYTPATAGTKSITATVTDSLGSTSPQSSPATVTVNSALVAPTVTPTPFSIIKGQTSSLTSTSVTTGTSPYSYQWLQKAPGEGSFSPIGGATLASYTFDSAGKATGDYNFELQVSDNAGAVVTSLSATVTVTIGPLSKFAVVAPGSVTTGQPFTLTVTAQDALSNTIVAYSSSVGLTLSGAGSTINPTSTGTTGWSSGVWTSTTVTVSATGGSGYTITADDGSLHTGTSNPFTINLATVAIQFSTNGVGTDTGSATVITIDSTPYTYAQIQALPPFQWTPGTLHAIAAESIVSGAAGTQYVFTSWSDLGAQSHDYTTPSSPATVTVNYGTEYQLTMATNLGTTSPAAGTAWYPAGAFVTISATSPTPGAGERYVWGSWTGTGSGSYTGTNNPASNAVTMNAPITETASWSHQWQLTVTASPSGAIGGTFAITYTQGGSVHTNEAHTTTWTGWADAGTTATASSAQTTVGTFTFSSYANNGATMNSAQTITLTYNANPIYVATSGEAHTPASLGSLGSFANMQNDDGTFATLGEQDTDASTGTMGVSGTSGTNYITIQGSDMAGGVFNAGGSGRIQSVTFHARGDSSTVSAKIVITDSSGNILANGVSNVVSNIYSGYGSDADYTASFATPPVVQSGQTYWLMVIPSGDLRLYYSSTTGGTSKSDTTNSYTTPTNPTDASSGTYTFRRLYASINYDNYRLDQEVQFAAGINSAYTRLQIKTGVFSDSEGISVERWDGATWVAIGALTAGTVNTFDSIPLTGGTLQLRFIDATQSSDPTSSTWQIDYVRLVVP
jgi:large repetitive protein